MCDRYPSPPTVKPSAWKDPSGRLIPTSKGSCTTMNHSFDYVKMSKADPPTQIAFPVGGNRSFWRELTARIPSVRN